MNTLDERAIARWRVHTLALTGRRRYPSAEAAVGGTLAVQAEQHRHALWALACRSQAAAGEAELAREFDAGRFLRTHVLRPTWHYVTPEDIRWLLELTGPRIRRIFVAHQRELGVDDALLERCTQVVVDAVAAEGPLTREAIGERLRDEGLPGDGGARSLVLVHAELSCLVCSGPTQDGRHTYALLQDRAPGARRLDRDAALAELVLRYVEGHGPVTERDLAYWASLTLTDVRAGLAAVADQLERFEHEGRTFWHTGRPPDDAPLEPRGHLLLVLDELHNGYQDSRSVIDADGLVPQRRAANLGMAVVDAQVVGDVRRTLSNRRVRFEVGTFRDLDPDEAAALHAAADRYGAFLGLDAELELARR